MKRKELHQIIEDKISSCQKCDLFHGRKKSVPGEGNLFADLMIVGEGPGQNENDTGRPFVGLAGELLTNVLDACGLPREKVYITNCVKCRPPQNRTPFEEEISACSAYLDLQIRLIKPKLIMVLGSTALKRLALGYSVMSSRGKFYDIGGPIKTRCYVTFHPAFILREQKYKDVFVGDFIEAIDYLNNVRGKNGICEMARQSRDVGGTCGSGVFEPS